MTGQNKFGKPDPTCVAMNNLPKPSLISEQGACLIVNKPGGLLTQGPPGIDSLELRIKQWLKRRDEKPGKVYLGVPHRLDRPASGVMLFAKNARAAKWLSQQFQERTIDKTYWAVVEGVVENDSGTWIDHMKKLPDQAKSEITDENRPGCQEAILRYEVLARNADQSWLRIKLETGRTHQIRLQASHRGYPIVGDELYGATTPFGPRTADVRKRWIGLHAREIGFEHPMTRERVQIRSDLWGHWDSLDFRFSANYVES